MQELAFAQAEKALPSVLARQQVRRRRLLQQPMRSGEAIYLDA
jgi:hypothetical protein